MAETSDELAALQAELAGLRAQHMALQLMLLHEARTPLGVIQGFAGMLRADQPAAEQARCREMIARYGHRLACVLDDLSQRLDLDRGLLVPRPVGADPQSLLEAAVAEAQSLDATWEPVMACPPDLPAVWADPGLAQHIAFTLLRNAWCHTDGRVRLEARADRASGHVTVAVRDAGPAFPPGACEALFEPLAQLPARTGNWPRTGLGLGLYVGRALARAMGGELWLEAGHPGNAFCLNLPIAPGAS